MIYVFQKDLAEIKSYAKSHKISLSQLAREALRMRMSQESEQYITGLNDGLEIGMEEIRKSNWAQMTFPSGKTFADLICEELERKKHGSGKAKRATKKAERDAEGSGEPADDAT
jgi:hypothetical protein